MQDLRHQQYFFDLDALQKDYGAESQQKVVGDNQTGIFKNSLIPDGAGMAQAQEPSAFEGVVGFTSGAFGIILGFPAWRVECCSGQCLEGRGGAGARWLARNGGI